MGAHRGEGHKHLDHCVRDLLATSWEKARKAIERGQIFVDGVAETDTRALVREGADIVYKPHAKRASVGLEPRVVHLDSQVVVLNKPAGMSTIPYEDERGTLDEWTRKELQRRTKEKGRPSLGVVHRIDKETSGLLVFTRTWLAKESLSSQFRSHTVDRRYLALVHGVVTSQTIRSHLIENRGDGLKGSFEHTIGKRQPNLKPNGQIAITHIELIERLSGASLVQCRLETGRTHQIRIHLSELGHPLVGERVYIRHYKGDILHAGRMMLHATELGFEHPKTLLRAKWEVPPPDDFVNKLDELRASTLS